MTTLIDISATTAEKNTNNKESSSINNIDDLNSYGINSIDSLNSGNNSPTIITQPSPPPMRIMKRNPSLNTLGSSNGNQKKPVQSIEEKQLSYQKARERIFMEMELEKEQQQQQQQQNNINNDLGNTLSSSPSLSSSSTTTTTDNLLEPSNNSNINIDSHMSLGSNLRTSSSPPLTPLQPYQNILPLGITTPTTLNNVHNNFPYAKSISPNHLNNNNNSSYFTNDLTNNNNNNGNNGYQIYNNFSSNSPIYFNNYPVQQPPISQQQQQQQQSMHYQHQDKMYIPQHQYQNFNYNSQQYQYHHQNYNQIYHQPLQQQQQHTNKNFYNPNPTSFNNAPINKYGNKPYQ